MLNPCKYCGDIVNVQIDEDAAFCIAMLGCDHQVEHDGTLQSAIAAWNAANPVNNAENGQHEALDAVQQALAAVLLERFALPEMPIYRDDLWGCYSDAADLLISQGVLVEIDGRITIKGV